MKPFILTNPLPSSFAQPEEEWGWQEPAARAFPRDFGEFTMRCQHLFEADTTHPSGVGGQRHTEAARRELHESNNQSK